jgi:hypothetical protein
VFGWVDEEVVAFDDKVSGEGKLVGTGGGVFGVDGSVEEFGAVFGEVGDSEFDRVKDGRDTWSGAIEVIAEGVFEEGDIDDAVVLGVADFVNEGTYGVGGVSTASESAEGGHSGVIPTVDDALLDELEEFAFGHEGEGEVESVELDLSWAVVVGAEKFDEVVVEGPVHLEFEGTKGVSDAFEEVGLSVSEVVHGVDVPGGAGAVMRSFDDAIDDGVTEVHIGGGHVDFGTQRHGTFVELAVVHTDEEVKGLVCRSFAERRGSTGLCGRPFLERDELGGLWVDVGESLFNESAGEVKELREVVGGVDDMLHVEAKPGDVVDDGIDELGVLARGIGVIESEHADTAVLVSNTEVEADGFGVSDVEVAIGFGREASLDASVIAIVVEVSFNGGLDEIKAGHRSMQLSRAQR